jgi:hypothetical protein
MIKFRLLFCLLITFAIGFAQETVQQPKKLSLRKQVRAAAKVQIYQLKNGALLVRLKTKKPNIAAFRKMGKNIQADKLEKKQAQVNANIIAAFKSKFTFCPTYFFYSDYSNNVKEKELHKVVFLNDSLRPDSNIKFEQKSFLVAEFGLLQQDTAKHFSHNSYEPDKNFNRKQVSHYNGGPNLGLDGLIISSEQLVQLRHPFPYFIRTIDPMPKKRVIYRAVRKLNKRLYWFYNKKNNS